MATPRSIVRWLAAIVVLGLATPVWAQRGRGAQALPDNPADVIQTLNGFKIELVQRADPQNNGSWISMTKDDKGRLILGGQRGQPLTRLTIADGKVAKEEILRLPVSEVMGALWVNDALYVDGAAQLPGDPGGPYSGGPRGAADARGPDAAPATAPSTQPGARAGRGRGRG